MVAVHPNRPLSACANYGSRSSNCQHDTNSALIASRPGAAAPAYHLCEKRRVLKEHRMTAAVEVLTRDQVPVEETWDLSRIYLDQAAWDADAAAYQAAVEKVAQHRGHLADSPLRLKEAVEDVLKVSFLGERLFVYARLRSDADTADSAARGLTDRITAL